MKENAPKQHVAFDPKLGYPRGPHLFYECLECGGVLPSMPKDNDCCACYNIRIDVDAGRLAVKDGTKLKLFSRSRNADQSRDDL